MSLSLGTATLTLGADTKTLRKDMARAQANVQRTMKEIGVTLDLSESRVSQMHSSILARLQAQMQYRDKEF